MLRHNPWQTKGLKLLVEEIGSTGAEWTVRGTPDDGSGCVLLKEEAHMSWGPGSILDSMARYSEGKNDDAGCDHRTWFELRRPAVGLQETLDARVELSERTEFPRRPEDTMFTADYVSSLVHRVAFLSAPASATLGGGTAVVLQWVGPQTDMVAEHFSVSARRTAGEGPNGVAVAWEVSGTLLSVDGDLLRFTAPSTPAGFIGSAVLEVRLDRSADVHGCAGFAGCSAEFHFTSTPVGVILQ